MTPAAVDIPYRLAWRARSARAGAHRSSVNGSGGMFRDLTSLLDARDPRRIDLRQSLRDPFEAIHVRRFEQASSVGVVMLLDTSASMSFSGCCRKFELARQLAGTIGSSALRTGDAFSISGADTIIRPEVGQPPTRSRSALGECGRRLAAFRPTRAGSEGLVEAARRIGTRRCLVFLVSDFLMPASQTRRIFDALNPHDVIPVCLHDSAEMEALPEWGLVELADLESGRRRLVFLRPSLKAAWRKQTDEHRSTFRKIARSYGREPFEITDAVDWDRLGAHLVSGVRGQ